MNEATVEDIVIDREKRFAFPELLSNEYFQKYRRGYYSSREQGLLAWHRNYVNLLTFLDEMHEYNEQHAKSFVKRLHESAHDWKNCEAIFSEIIVYCYYIRAAYEGLIRRLKLDAAESDIIVERLDGTIAYLEVFCVMPSFPLPEDGKVVVRDVKTHTQTEMASIRQKLLRKITKQKQLSKPRENYAVIELNDLSIVGDFTVLSSLSSGYTVTINKETMKIESSGYNWENSIFEDQSTEFLKAIIYFDLGNYGSRRFLLNPNFRTPNNCVEPMP
ncbi:MAG: hypothetical protein GY721_10765 [Deltaproteobacteria bacterium]|nr:hypothetical protein [Deltaproteobacteria bacterium]